MSQLTWQRIISDCLHDRHYRLMYLGSIYCRVAVTVIQVIYNDSKLRHCSLDKNNPAKRKHGYRCANCLFTDLLRSSHEDVINAKRYNKNNSLSPANFLPMANAISLFSLTGGMGDGHIPLHHTLYPASERCNFAWGLERCPLLPETWLAETPGHWGKKHYKRVEICF